MLYFLSTMSNQSRDLTFEASEKFFVFRVQGLIVYTFACKWLQTEDVFLLPIELFKKNDSLVSNFKAVEVPLTAWRATSTCWKFFLQLSMNGFLRAVEGPKNTKKRKLQCFTGR
jgi:hypothetical protein